jgi:nitrogen fixation NifU-like protein
MKGINMSKKIREHLLRPRNCGLLTNPDGVGIESENPWMITIMIAIKVDKGYIRRIAFQTKGCATSIASASVLTELVQGKSIQEAISVSVEALSGALGKVPNEKLHCCRLARQALHLAIDDYRRKKSNQFSAPATKPTSPGGDAFQ